MRRGGALYVVVAWGMLQGACLIGYGEAGVGVGPTGQTVDTGTGGPADAAAGSRVDSGTAAGADGGAGDGGSRSALDGGQAMAPDPCNGMDDDVDGSVDESGCPAGCEGRILGSEGFALCSVPATGDDAERRCSDMGMSLARVDSLEQEDRMRAHFTEQGLEPLFFVGGSDRAEEGVWRWPDGEIIWPLEEGSTTYTNWRMNEPNDANEGEDCLEVRFNGWNDTPCTDLLPYVCGG